MPSKFIVDTSKPVTWTKDIQTIIRDAKLDYEVIKSPIYYITDKNTVVMGDRKYVEIKNNFVCVNKKTGYAYSTVSKTYTVANNVNVFTFLNVPTAKGLIKPVYAGEVERGAKAFIYFTSPTVICGDLNVDFLAINSHDGKNGVELVFMPYNKKFNCTIGVPYAKQIYRHSSQFDKTALSYADYLEKEKTCIDKLNTAYATLSSTYKSDDECHEILMRPLISRHTNKEVTAYAIKSVERILTIATERKEGKYYSLWELLLAANNYAEHELPYKAAEMRNAHDFWFLRNVYGASVALKVKVFDALIST